MITYEETVQVLLNTLKRAENAEVRVAELEKALAQLKKDKVNEPVC